MADHSGNPQGLDKRPLPGRGVSGAGVVFPGVPDPLLDCSIGFLVWFVVGPGASGRAPEVPETPTDGLGVPPGGPPNLSPLGVPVPAGARPGPGPGPSADNQQKTQWERRKSSDTDRNCGILARPTSPLLNRSGFGVFCSLYLQDFVPRPAWQTKTKQTKMLNRFFFGS